jgi:CRP-like cAMP-binding protein
MQTDLRARSSLPLQHDHFRSDTDERHVATPRDKAPHAAPTLSQATQQVAKGAKRAMKVAMVAGRQAAMAARWSGEKSFRFASRLGKLIGRRPVKPAGSAEFTHYATVPNRLSALAELSREQHALVRTSLPGRRTHQAGSTLVAQGEPSAKPEFILSGWACRTRLQDGRLHLLGILVPGDGISLYGPPCALASTTLMALTTLETVDAAPVMAMAEDADDNSALRLSMHRAMAEDEAFLLNQTVRLLMRPATARLAHLLLELQYRLGRVGLVSENIMPFPFDRQTLAGALGLSPRIVGKAVRTLEQRRIARFGHGRVVIRREDMLRKLATFTPPAFSERPGRPMISDVGTDILIEHAPWMETASQARAQAYATRQ